MATKSITLNQAKTISDILFANWENDKSSLKVSSITLFRLISLKNTLQNEMLKTQEALAAIAYNCGGEDQLDGTIKVPDERMPEANRALRELGDEVLDIEYSPIILREEDSIPVALMEALMEFIEIKE